MLLPRCYHARPRSWSSTCRRSRSAEKKARRMRLDADPRLHRRCCFQRRLGRRVVSGQSQMESGLTRAGAVTAGNFIIVLAMEG